MKKLNEIKIIMDKCIKKDCIKMEIHKFEGPVTWKCCGNCWKYINRSCKIRNSTFPPMISTILNGTDCEEYIGEPYKEL